MAIDPLSEDLISFSTAARIPPARRRGRPCHVSTIHRWARHGCRSATGEIVRLESIRAGGCLATSRQAMRRFFQRLTDSTQPQAEAPRTVAERQRAAAKAEAELLREGV